MKKEECPKEILGKNTSHDLEVLRKKRLLGNFYIAGGTGIALILKHRRSYDLDFFNSENFNLDLLTDKISKLGHFELEKREEGTVIGLFKNTRVSFFYYPYLLLNPPRIICGISVADLVDVACMKINAIASRGSKKDFLDLYMIIQNDYSLEELLNFFTKKYANLNYNMIHIQKGLVYFDDANKDPEPLMLKLIEWTKVKKFFRNEVKKLSQF